MAKPAATQAPAVDSSRWVIVYPAYLNAKKTVQEGRRVRKDIAPENPTAQEMFQVAKVLGLECVLEAEKVYPRSDEHFNPLNRGRLRVQLKDGAKGFKHATIHTRQDLWNELAKAIAKLSTRSTSSASSSSSSPATPLTSSGGAGDAKAASPVSDKPQKKRGKKDKH